MSAHQQEGVKADLSAREIMLPLFASNVLGVLGHALTAARLRARDVALLASAASY